MRQHVNGCLRSGAQSRHACIGPQSTPRFPTPTVTPTRACASDTQSHAQAPVDSLFVASMCGDASAGSGGRRVGRLAAAARRARARRHHDVDGRGAAAPPLPLLSELTQGAREARPEGGHGAHWWGRATLRARSRRRAAGSWNVFPDGGQAIRGFSSFGCAPQEARRQTPKVLCEGDGSGWRSESSD